MDLLNLNFPCTVDINVVKAYMNLERLKSSQSDETTQRIRAFDINWDAHLPKTLRKLALDKIVENWADTPLFQEIPRQADRNYILTNLDLNVPLRTSSARIKDDYFWRKSYHHRWKVLPPDMEVRPWINVYMEKHLQEYLENLDVCDYDQEGIQTVLDVCGPYINKLNIEKLQPSMGERSDHIPLDFVLSNLPDLKYFRVTYCTKTIGTNFYLGCSSFSRNDIVSFARGLSRSYELTEFWIHSVKLEPIHLALIARALDKACQHLTKLAITHCAMHDDGLQHFLDSCTRESFTGLTSLDLTNNYISSEGAYLLGRVLRGRPLERLILRLNPIQSDGAAAIFSAVQHLPVKELDVSGCSMTGTITKLLMQLVVQNNTILSMDASNNDFGEDFGQKVYKVIGFNKVLRRLDLRNTGVTIEVKNKINDVLRRNQ